MVARLLARAGQVAAPALAAAVAFVRQQEGQGRRVVRPRLEILCCGDQVQGLAVPGQELALGKCKHAMAPEQMSRQGAGRHYSSVGSTVEQAVCRVVLDQAREEGRVECGPGWWKAFFPECGGRVLSRVPPRVPLREGSRMECSGRNGLQTTVVSYRTTRRVLVALPPVTGISWWP